MLNLGLLVYALRAKLGPLGWKDIGQSAGRSIISSIAMGLVVWAIAGALIPLVNRSLPGLLAGVVVSIGIGLCVYGIMSFVLNSRELHSVLTEARKKVGRK
jgi:peptidoglycan biosynthesis protein MviN/MurJ (putative lipid II flippase)